MQVPVYAYIFKLKSLQVDTNNRKKNKKTTQSANHKQCDSKTQLLRSPDKMGNHNAPVICSPGPVGSSWICLCWGFTAQLTQWVNIERGQFT